MPHLLRKWTVKEEMTKCLQVTWARVTVGCGWIEVLDTCPKWQRIEQSLVDDVTLLRSRGRMPDPLPEIPWGIGKAGNGTSIPIQSFVDTIALVQKASNSCCCKIRKRGTCGEKTRMGI